MADAWVEALDASGRTFYHNKVTKKSVWRDPRAKPVSTPSGEPTDWVMCMDAASGKPFYYNSKTRERKWRKPAALRAPRPVPMPTQLLPVSATPAATPPASPPASPPAAPRFPREKKTSMSRSLYGVTGSFSEFTVDSTPVSPAKPSEDDGEEEAKAPAEEAPMFQGVVITVDDTNAVDVVGASRLSPAPLTFFDDHWDALEQRRNAPTPPLLSVGNPNRQRSMTSPLSVPSDAEAPHPPPENSGEAAVAPPTPLEPTPMPSAADPGAIRLLSVDGQWEQVTHPSFPRPFFRHVSGTTTWLRPDDADFMNSSSLWRSMHPTFAKSSAQTTAARQFLGDMFGQWPPRSLAPVLSKATRRGLDNKAKKIPVAPPTPPHVATATSPAAARKPSVASTTASPSSTTSPFRRVAPPAEATYNPYDAGSDSSLPPFVAMRIASELEHRSRDLADLKQRRPSMYSTLMREQGQLGRVKGSTSTVFPEKERPHSPSATLASAPAPSAGVAPSAGSQLSSASQRRASLAAYLKNRSVFHVEEKEGDEGAYEA